MTDAARPPERSPKTPSNGGLSNTLVRILTAAVLAPMVVLLVLCLTTNWFQLQGETWPVMAGPWPYLALWGGGLAVWAPTFWALRRQTCAG